MSKTNTQNARVSSFRPLNTPMHAVDAQSGQAIRCIAYGDVEGNSPSYLTVDGQGQSQWQSFSDVRIIDTNFLPLSSEANQSLQNAGAGSGTGGSGGSSSARK